LAVFVKAPEVGRVKSRLAAGIGAVEAARVYRAFVAALLRRLARDRRWRTTLWVAPDRAARPGRRWAVPAAVRPQGGGDLGRRMARPFRELPPGPVVLVGSDIPELGPAQVAAAFALLGRSDAVFGPARDGGYWLVGLRRRRRLPFAGVRWSTAHALADTLANLGTARVALLAPLADIDDAADYDAWRARRRPSAFR
jgi:hypothetical protein